MNKSFATRNDLLVLNVFYTKENAKELEIQINPSMQEKLFEQWNFIKKNINNVIVQSNF